MFLFLYINCVCFCAVLRVSMKSFAVFSLSLKFCLELNGVSFKSHYDDISNCSGKIFEECKYYTDQNGCQL